MDRRDRESCKLVFNRRVEYGNLTAEAYRSERGHQQKHDDSVGYEPPLDVLPSAVGGIKQ